MTRLPAEADARPPTPRRAQFEGRSRLKAACEIRLDRIVADPNQPRTSSTPTRSTGSPPASGQRGQLQPIRVRWDEALDRYVVVVGERRWRRGQTRRAWTSIACVVAPAQPPPEEILEDQLVENCLREDLRPIEQARAFRTLLSRLGDLAASARRTAPGQPPDDHPGPGACWTCPTRSSRRSTPARSRPRPPTRSPGSTTPQAQAEAAAQAAQGRLRRDDMREMVTRAPRQSRGAQKPWVHNVDGRVRVTVAALADDVPHEELVDALRSALAALRKKSRGQAA